MTIRELIALLGHYPSILIGIFSGIPLITILLGLFHKKTATALAPWKYLYSLLTYLTCLPGMLSAVLVGYTLFFAHENLLDANALVYFLPLVSMVLTLILIGKRVSFNDLPGFERLSSLMILLGGAFAIVLLVHKLFIGVFFGGNIAMLFALGAGVALLLQWAVYSLFRGSREPRRPRPSLFG